ncbi:MAG: ATP-binding protein [Propionibacteriaceae bacterium]|jgi:AAA+ ATPase superfamily predicted ATPase|nr:ATP-binding protein [Propionibacteriaceae bacterium]
MTSPQASTFVGRTSEFLSLSRLLDEVRTGGDRPGRAMVIRGRRRVGKSRLVEEFCATAAIPYTFFTALGQSRELDAQSFIAEVENTCGETLPVQASDSWIAILRATADALPQDNPSIIVLDEMPYLVAEDNTFEGALQASFDRFFSRLPVLIILIGSDISAMERITSPGHPFYQRGSLLTVKPLRPVDVRTATGLDSSDSLDAYLITGGLPLLLRRWREGDTVTTYLRHEFEDPASPLLTSAELTLAEEFPTEAHAGTILAAIGNGETTFTAIARVSNLASSTLTRALDVLTGRGIVTIDTPVSTTRSNNPRYRVTDPYLRFWFIFGEQAAIDADRGRPDLTWPRIEAGWSAWRGKAIEPVIRESLWTQIGRLLPITGTIGSYWTRTNSVEIDIVAADKGPVGKHLDFVGSIKWLEQRPFGTKDFTRLVTHRSQLPGATDETPLVAVSRAGVDVDGVIAIGPDDLFPDE